MPAIAIKPDLYWIGVNDRTTDLFEGLWPISQEGVSYNTYLIKGEQSALIDLVKDNKQGELLDQLADVINLEDLDYLVINHMEPDHSGALRILLRLVPDLTILGTSKTKQMLETFYGVTDRVRVVEDGETLSLGEKNLEFVYTPFVHWPETMMTYESATRVLFSCDGFGGYGALRGTIFDDQCTDQAWYQQEALRYYVNIVAKFSRPVLRAIEKLADTPVDVIAPSHGLIWRSHPETIIALYREWAGLATDPGEPGVTLIYGSMYGNTEEMMNAVAEGISKVGLPLEIFDAARTHVSYILPTLWQYSGVMVGAPTYEGSLFPPVAQALGMVATKRVLNKKAARFGSYAWSGGAQREFEKIVDPLKWALQEPFEFIGAPTKEQLTQGLDYGERFATWLLEEDDA
jgi:flavorubredoxin